MHWSLGNTQRGILAGYALAVLAAVAGAIHNDTSWNDALYLILIASGAPIGALIDPGSAPPKT